MRLAQGELVWCVDEHQDPWALVAFFAKTTDGTRRGAFRANPDVESTFLKSSQSAVEEYNMDLMNLRLLRHSYGRGLGSTFLSR